MADPVASMEGNQMRLAGEVAVVTGSTKGMEKAIAERFATEGAKVVLTGRTATLGREVETSIRRHGGEAVFVCMDQSREDDVRAAMSTAVSTYGKLTILVNNAAPTEWTVGPGAIDGTIVGVSTEGWNTTIVATLYGPFWACKYAMTEMAKSGGGAVVNISSIGALLGNNGTAAYSAAKSAMLALTRSAAVEGAADKIRANCIVPGAVPIPGRTDALLADPTYRDALLSLQLTGLGEPADIANAALFLASQEAKVITGITMPVDGGATCKMPLPAMTNEYWAEPAAAE
ncbi:SDR family NAD(P)-dependent oxidoreductase [Mycolicibacterium porcinum]|uniref:SDR family oxidoreductase n=1 Tax=Mycolicibacterium porcinum TaxID=39693 RepID=A0AAW5SX41_9MYCO|nr:SDR family NAD(P)-dependent oxidoreductase [Mycolicibacterium porcinum]MCV7386458.1 SDR family oxidoreductase [Mycolicibacterium porcinum]